MADLVPDAPPEEKLRARARVITEWMAGHADRDALKRDLEAARLAWADIRHAGDVPPPRRWPGAARSSRSPTATASGGLAPPGAPGGMR